MIERYQTPEMKKLWSDKTKFDTYLQVEIAVLEAYAKFQIVPKEDVDLIKKKANVNLDRVYELEEITKHDVIAFTRAIGETLGDEKKWIHYGLTSTDVVDTSQSLILKQANNIIEKDLTILLETLNKKAIQYRNTPIIGRTHGIHAEITSFGLKYLLWFDELQRNTNRFRNARKDIEMVKLSGAVGNYANIEPYIEDTVASNLKLNTPNIATQVLSRDRHSYYVMTLALIASTLEKIATEIRSLSRTEINEVNEYFDKNQKGSSAMPHKRNPIGCENICGLARVVKGYVSVALENNTLWHERDISHSSSERILLPDCTTLISYLLRRMTKIIETLVVNEDRMLSNISMTYNVVYSGAVLSYLIGKGYTREKAYDLIQPLTFEAMNTKTDFKDILIKNNILSVDEINKCFDINYYLRNIDILYRKDYNNEK